MILQPVGSIFWIIESITISRTVSDIEELRYVYKYRSEYKNILEDSLNHSVYILILLD